MLKKIKYHLMQMTKCAAQNVQNVFEMIHCKLKGIYKYDICN